MSQTVTPARVPGRPSPGAGGVAPGDGPDAAPVGRVAAVRAGVRHYFSGSPGRLRQIAIVAVVGALLAAAGGGLALRERSAALTEARASAGQLVLLQGIRTALVQAHADATNSFLRGGLEDPAQRADYVAGLDAASRGLPSAAANADESQAATFGQVSEAVSRYSGSIEAARANNRQGFPVGAAYLANATTTLNDEIVPDLTSLADAEADDVSGAFSAAGLAGWLFLLAALVGLGVLVWAQVRLARHPAGC